MRKKLNKADRLAVWLCCEGKCFRCGKWHPLDSSWHAHHTIPFKTIGSNPLEHLAVSCGTCNRAQSDRYSSQDMLTNLF